MEDHGIPQPQPETQPDPYEARVAALGQAITQLTQGETNGNRLLMLGIAAGTFIKEQAQGDVTAILAGLALLNTYASNVIGTTMALETLKLQGEEVARRAEAEAMAAAEGTDTNDPAWDAHKALCRAEAERELAEARHYIEAVRSGRFVQPEDMEEFERAAAKLEEYHALRLEAIDREPREQAAIGHWLKNVTRAWAAAEAETGRDLPAPVGSGEVRGNDPFPVVVEALENARPRRDNGDPSGGKGLQEAVEE